MTDSRLPIHPYAELFPPLSSPEFDRLCGDIAVHGLQEDIVVHEGKILDGRHRYLACLARQVPPRFRDYAGECGAPLSFVVTRNCCRRHLTDSQRALLAAKLKPLFEAEARQRQVAGLRRGSDFPVRENSPERGSLGKNSGAAQQAAELMRVSDFSVKAADKVNRQGVPELVDAVAAGKVAVSAAAQIAMLPAEQQEQVAAGIQSGLKPKDALAQVQQAPPPDEAPLVDDAGEPLPEQALAAFQQRRQLRALCRRLGAFRREVVRLAESAVGIHLDSKQVLNCLGDAERTLFASLPAHVCPACRGAEPGCDLCRGHGWVTAASGDKQLGCSGTEVSEAGELRA